MRPYGRRPPKGSTPSWVCENNRDGRQLEKAAARWEVAASLGCERCGGETTGGNSVCGDCADEMGLLL